MLLFPPTEKYSNKYFQKDFLLRTKLPHNREQNHIITLLLLIKFFYTSYDLLFLIHFIINEYISTILNLIQIILNFLQQMNSLFKICIKNILLCKYLWKQINFRKILKLKIVKKLFCLKLNYIWELLYLQQLKEFQNNIWDFISNFNWNKIKLELTW